MKFFHFIILILFVGSNVGAQPTPWVFPGNTPSGTDFLGSTNTNPLELKTTNTSTPQPINFYTNNTQRMTLSSGGNLGINLTNPQNLLHVHSGVFQITNGTTGSGAGSGLLIGMNGTSMQIQQQESAPMLFLVSNATPKMNIAANGNVAIGMSSTGGGRRLEIRDAAVDYQLRLSYDASHYADLGSNSFGDLIIDPIRNVAIGANPPGTYHLFTVAQTGQSNNETAGVFTSESTGILVQATSTNIGVGAEIISDGAASSHNRAVSAKASGSSASNTAVYAECTGTNGSNYAIYAVAANGSGPTDLAAYLNGDAVITNGTWSASDEMLKTNIQPFADAMSKIEQIAVSQYDFKLADFPSMNLPEEAGQIGVLAENLAVVFPNLVQEVTQPQVLDDAGNEVYSAVDYSVVNYVGLVPVLLKGIQELSVKVDELEAQLNDCCGQFGKEAPGSDEPENLNKQSIELNNAQKSSLGQSIPNPHNGQCTIPYFIDETVTKAEIVFYDEMGKEINRVILNGHGNGQVTVLSSQLAEGVYIYSLFADGDLIETKRMVKQ